MKEVVWRKVSGVEKSELNLIANGGERTMELRKDIFITDLMLLDPSKLE